MARTSMPKISIIIPNHNHAPFLPRRIDSVLQQTFQDFELILLDDCSTDESRSVLSLYADDPRVRMEFNRVNSRSTFNVTEYQATAGLTLADNIHRRPVALVANEFQNTCFTVRMPTLAYAVRLSPCLKSRML